MLRVLKETLDINGYTEVKMKLGCRMNVELSSEWLYVKALLLGLKVIVRAITTIITQTHRISEIVLMVRATVISL